MPITPPFAAQALKISSGFIRFVFQSARAPTCVMKIGCSLTSIVSIEVWSPECEIRLVETALKGDTVEMAAAVVLSERLAACDRIDQAAEVVREAAKCQLADALEDARRRLQAMAVEAGGFAPLARASARLAETIRYGTVRRIDPEPLRPLLAQLFLRAALRVKPGLGA